MGAPKGNQNRWKGMEWTDQLRWALANYEDSPSAIERGQALRTIAVNVVKSAIGGDWRAIEEIGNRLEGKPAQAVQVAGDSEGGPIRHALEVLFVEAASSVSGQAPDSVPPE